MALYPNTKHGRIDYFNSKTGPWATNATAIGTTAGAVTALEGLVTSAQTKFADQVAAEEAAKAATALADAAVATMIEAGMDIVANIRAKADNSADPAAVYGLAEIPAPSGPTPVSTLGTPTDFKVELGADGALTIRWKCSNPRATGTIYQVWRKLESEATFSYLGGTGEKKFTDATVPSTSSTTMYKIQAVRSTATGPWGICTVLFGMSATGALTAEIVSAAKLAA